MDLRIQQNLANLKSRKTKVYSKILQIVQIFNPTLFLQNHTCFDLMPKNSRVVLIHKELKTSHAFQALIVNGVRAAPICDELTIIGMLTITDLMHILLSHAGTGMIGNIGDLTVAQWREITQISKRPLTYILSSATLWEAVNKLLDVHVHRLPVFDSRADFNPMQIITLKRVVKFIFISMQGNVPKYMSSSIADLAIGTTHCVITCHQRTTVYEALSLMRVHGISSLPLLETGTNHIVDLFSRFDSINIVAETTREISGRLNETVSDALLEYYSERRPIRTCLLTDSLITVIERIVKFQVLRLVIVDEDDRLVVRGIVSLSDLMKFLLRKHQ